MIGRKIVMDQSEAARLANHSPRECAELIRKLRWIGLDNEAERLQHALSILPANIRGSVCVGPSSTD
jgi:hypothetical protein